MEAELVSAVLVAGTVVVAVVVIQPCLRIEAEAAVVVVVDGVAVVAVGGVGAPIAVAIVSVLPIVSVVTIAVSVEAPHLPRENVIVAQFLHDFFLNYFGASSLKQRSILQNKKASTGLLHPVNNAIHNIYLLSVVGRTVSTTIFSNQ